MMTEAATLTCQWAPVFLQSPFDETSPKKCVKNMCWFNEVFFQVQTDWNVWGHVTTHKACNFFFFFKNEDQLNIGVYAMDGAASKAGNQRSFTIFT